MVEPYRLSRKVPLMPKTRPPYAPEFRRQMVDLVRAGRGPADLAREFEPSAQAIRTGAALAGVAYGPTAGMILIRDAGIPS